MYSFKYVENSVLPVVTIAAVKISRRLIYLWLPLLQSRLVRRLIYLWLPLLQSRLVDVSSTCGYHCCSQTSHLPVVTIAAVKISQTSHLPVVTIAAVKISQTSHLPVVTIAAVKIS